MVLLHEWNPFATHLNGVQMQLIHRHYNTFQLTCSSFKHI